VGRRPPAGAADPTRATELTVQFELAAPKAARADDWQVVLTPAAGASITMKPWFELPVYARDDLGPDRPQWRVRDGVARHAWKGSYAGFWESSHSRLRLRGRSDAEFVLESRGGDGGPQRLVTTLGALAAAPPGGTSPLGPWRLTASESFDAAIDLARTLGTRELAQEWRDESLAPGDHWYYARIVQADGEIAWSSPLFVSRR